MKKRPIEFGSFDKNKMHAMQFSTTDAKADTALIYKREKVSENEYTVKLNGLIADAVYEIYDTDAPETIYTLTGKELMNEGFSIALPNGKKAVIHLFSTK